VKAPVSPRVEARVRREFPPGESVVERELGEA
jgi:hypothetical protein